MLGKYLLMQSVDGNGMLCEVFLDLGLSPVRKRIDFDEGRVVRVFGDFRNLRAGDALFPAQARHPGVEPGPRRG